MSDNKPDTIMDIEELEKIARDRVTSIDFDALIKAGILEQHRGWYKVLKMDELPNHAIAKICKVETGSKGTLVKFRAPSKRLAKLLKMR
jgi:hypothetical protein